MNMHLAFCVNFKCISSDKPTHRKKKKAFRFRHSIRSQLQSKDSVDIKSETKDSKVHWCLINTFVAQFEVFCSSRRHKTHSLLRNGVDPKIVQSPMYNPHSLSLHAVIMYNVNLQ